MFVDSQIIIRNFFSDLVFINNTSIIHNLIFGIQHLTIMQVSKNLT
jgi:hypothetical protein